MNPETNQTNGTPAEVITRVLRAAGVDAKTARFWVAVSAHETGGWTSPIFRENNNLFGMRLPSRNTFAVGDNRGHAVFRSLEDSAKDLVLYFDRLKWDRLNFNTPDELTAYMKQKGYYTDSYANYSTAVRRWLQKI